jgi:carbamoyltransferase
VRRTGQGTRRPNRPEELLVRVLGLNAVFHDPAAALVVDGEVVAAAEEERFSRRKHGKRPVPFSTWELPELSARWCLQRAGIGPEDLDAVAYSYDPALAAPIGEDLTPGPRCSCRPPSPGSTPPS